MAPSLQQKLFVEFVGTALLCFTVSCLPKVAEDMVGITVGGVLMLLVYAGGPQSGGHYNPAVTLAILIRKGIEAKEAALYMAAQAVAAVAGAFLKSATIAVYWAGPALGAVIGTGLFKTAYKGESKKKSKRKTR